MDVLNDLFNPKVKVETEQANVTEFKPSSKKGTAGIYTAVIRFIPNPTDPAGKSIIQKYTTTLMNPYTNSYHTIDNPSSVGEPDPIVDMFFKLRKSSSQLDVEKSKYFSRRKSYASLIQVIKCDSEKNLEGKILVWRYGVKIFDKICQEMNPPIGDPRNPFDPVNGRLFNVKVTEVSGFNNYDQCQFLDLPASQSGMRIEINGKTIIVTQEIAENEQGRTAVFNYLKENCPDTTPYEYHSWDAKTTQIVDEIIRIYSGQAGQAATESYQQSAASLSDMMSQQSSAPAQRQQEPTPTTDPLSGLNLGVDVVNETTTTGATNVDLSNSDLNAILNANSGVKGSEDSGNNSGVNLGSLDDILNGNMY